MKVIAAMDSYKGCCSALAAGEAVLRGVLRADGTARVENIPVSDGGEGMVDALVHGGRGRKVVAEVAGPLGEPVRAEYAVLDGGTAVIEMSAASGLTLVPEEKRDPLRATTYGTGELIRAALDAGCRDLLIGIGGSATNDGGEGMARALGARFLDADGHELPPGGAALERLERIDVRALDARLEECRVRVASDVRNPLCGERGASAVYGPQKGATPAMVARLDRALARYAQVLREQLGEDVAERPGAGAAGGLGAGLYAFTHAEFQPGIDAVLDLLGFAGRVRDAALVFTGEGRTDGQTLFGKVPAGVARWTKSEGKIPVVVLSGAIAPGAEALYDGGVDGLFAIADGPISLSESQARAEALIERAAEAIVRTANALWRR